MSEPLTVPESATPNPNHSPSYPQRVHIRERAQWQAVLRTWDDRIAVALASAKGSSEASGKLFAQMAGARDQIGEAVKRLPMEVTDLYDEDKHRLEEAVASLERLMARGKEQGLLA